MGIFSNIKGFFEKRSASSAVAGLADSWYSPGGSFFGGSSRYPETRSGVRVSELSAMQLAIVCCCIKMLSEDSASLPLHLYRRRKGGGKDKAWADDRYILLHDQPNPEMTAMSFRESYMSHLLSWGNGYAEIERTNGRIKKPVALWPITPNRVQVRRDEKRDIKWHVSVDSGLSVVLPRAQILHTPGLSFNGLVGYSPIANMREALGLGFALEEFSNLYFGNGTHPGVVVSHPGKLDDKSRANLDRSLSEAHSGLGQTHRLLLLEEAMKIEKIGIPNNEAQFLESKKYTNVEIGTRIYRFPPQMYGEFEKAAAYASVEQLSIDYVTRTLRAWLVRLEQSFNMALLDPSERGVYFFEHNIEGLLRGDILSRYTAHQIARRNGIMNGDEWREIENMNPIPDGSGKVYIVEKNMIKVDDLGKDLNQAPQLPAPNPDAAGAIP